MRTPVTYAGLRAMDRLEPGEAALRAWSEAGPHPEWHRGAQNAVRRSLPGVADALNRGDAREATSAWRRRGLFMAARREHVRAIMPVLARALDRAASPTQIDP